jgi:hypothetical protein
MPRVPTFATIELSIWRCRRLQASNFVMETAGVSFFLRMTPNEI